MKGRKNNNRKEKKKKENRFEGRKEGSWRVREKGRKKELRKLRSEEIIN